MLELLTISILHRNGLGYNVLNRARSPLHLVEVQFLSQQKSFSRHILLAHKKVKLTKKDRVEWLMH